MPDQIIHEEKVLTYKGKVVFHKLALSSPKRELKPFMENEACFMFVNKGEFSVRTPDDIISFKKGKAMLAKCFNFFIETTRIQRKSNYMEVIGIYLFPEIIEELLNVDLSLSTHTVNYNLKQLQVDKLLDNFRESIVVLLDNPDLADESMVKTKLKEFLLLLSKTQSASQTEFLAALFKTNAGEFNSTISNNLYSNLSVAEFALLCSMSVSSFKRKFSETYHQSPKKYLLKMKLEKACKMLRSGTHRISEIAYDIGFDTISTFNRSFKAQYGQSPSEYRLAHSA